VYYYQNGAKLSITDTIDTNYSYKLFCNALQGSVFNQLFSNVLFYPTGKLGPTGNTGPTGPTGSTFTTLYVKGGNSTITSPTSFTYSDYAGGGVRSIEFLPQTSGMYAQFTVPVITNTGTNSSHIDLGITENSGAYYYFFGFYNDGSSSKVAAYVNGNSAFAVQSYTNPLNCSIYYDGTNVQYTAIDSVSNSTVISGSGTFSPSSSTATYQFFCDGGVNGYSIPITNVRFYPTGKTQKHFNTSYPAGCKYAESNFSPTDSTWSLVKTFSSSDPPGLYFVRCQENADSSQDISGTFILDTDGSVYGLNEAHQNFGVSVGLSGTDSSGTRSNSVYFYTSSVAGGGATYFADFYLLFPR
jgi:hypothetical protein